MLRRQLPLALCFIAGVFTAVQYFIPHHAVQDFYQLLLDWLMTLLAFAFLLGTVSLIKVHYHKIRNRADDRGFSFVVFFGLALTIGTGFLHGEHINPGSPFDVVFQNIQVPIEATMFSLLAFYIASAAFRAFRARTLEATLLLLAAAIVMPTDEASNKEILNSLKDFPLEKYRFLAWAKPDSSECIEFCRKNTYL